MVSKYRRTAQPNDFSGDPLNVANAGTAQRLQDPSISILGSRIHRGLYRLRRKSRSPTQVPEGDLIASRSILIFHASRGPICTSRIGSFPAEPLYGTRQLRRHALCIRGKACKEWNPGCRVQIFCRSTLLLLFQVSTTRTTVGERRQQVTKEDETCTRRWSNSRHQTW